MAEALQYWKTELEGSQPAEFLRDFKPSPKTEPQFETLDLSFDQILLQSLENYCHTHDALLEDVLQAAFRATHYRLTGVADATVGLAVAHNVHCIRASLDDTTTIADLIKLVATKNDKARRNGYSYEKLCRELTPLTSDGRGAHLVRTGFSFLQLQQAENGVLGDKQTNSEPGAGSFDIQLQLTQGSGHLHGWISFASHLFHIATIRAVASTYQDILHQICIDSSRLVNSVPLPGGLVELDRLGLSEAPKSDYPRDASIPTIFKQQVFLFKNKIAVKDSSGTSWTYEELDNVSDVLANNLRQRQLPPESLVGLLAPRSNQTIAALLGILKAGLAYLPLDINAPQGRIADILSLNKGRTLVLVGDGQPVPNVDEHDAEFVFISDLQTHTVNNLVPAQQYTEPSASSLAYVMYTSGSTGRPKGVMIEHRGIVRLVKNTNVISSEISSGVMAHLGNLVFDASTWEIFTALLNGGTLVCIDYMTLLDIEALHQLFRTEAIQATLLTPAFLKQCLTVREDLISDLDILLVGGDRFDVHDAIKVRSLLKPSAVLLDACGPAENTVASTVFPITDAEQFTNGVPVGKAVTNSGALVMDSDQKLVGPGVMGELVVTGDGLARGYTDSELNAGRFIELEIKGILTRAYRTGDCVRQRPIDGEMEFFGRLDHQIKIRGHRIELAEIDRVLLSQPSVSDAVTLATTRGADGLELVSFVTTKQAANGDDDAAEDHVKNWGDVFDNSAYTGIGSIELKDIGRDFESWTSMYDGKLIDVGEMNEWLDDTIATINRYKPKNVLEIGFGTGMIFFNICDQIESYVGIDPSNSAVGYVNNIVKQQPNLVDRVQVHCGSASDAAQIAITKAPDTVIINSVAQYFPSCDYLRELVEGLLQVDSIQRIFFGDMRSYALYREFRVERAMREHNMVATKGQIRKRIAELEDVEEEFLVDPAFFTALPDTLPEQVQHVEILPKRMKTTNELSCYRYAAVIHTKHSNCHVVASPEKWTDFISQQLNRQRLTSLLQSCDSDELAITNIPNEKILVSKHITGLLDLDNGSSVEEIDWHAVKAQLPPEVCGAMSALGLVQVAEECGWAVEINYARQHAAYGQLDAVFSKESERKLYRFPKTGGTPTQKLSTNPVQQRQAHDTATSLHTALRNSLPSYMVPNFIELLDSMPVNPNGKVDRKALEKLAVDVTPVAKRFAETIAPKNELEKFLCEELLALLRLDVGTQDNFFDLGGHSLIATRLVSRINQRLNVRATVSDIFSFPKVADLASHLGQLVTSDDYVGIPSFKYQGPVEQSFAQSRLFFLERLYPDSDWYLVPVTLRIQGNLDVKALQNALLGIEQRHESLRTVFEEHGGVCFQTVRPFTPKPFEVISVSNEAELLERLNKTQRRPFHISTEPGWRVELFQVGSSEFVLSTVMHHIITDGWSLEILKREIAALYNAARRGEDPLSAVAPLPVHYRDFTIWQKQPPQEAEHQKQLKYWMKILKDSQPATFLYDKVRPPVPSGAADTHELHIDGELYRSLKIFCKQNQITPYVALFAAFRATQFRLTGAADSTIGTPSANRNREELENLIGFFVNMQCIRSHIGKQSFTSLLQQIRKSTSEAATNQDLPFERLVAELMREGRDISRNPLVQIVFAFHERQDDDDQKLDNLETTSLETLHTTRFDLEFHLFHEENALRGSFVFATDLMDVKTVELISRTLKTILGQVIKNPELLIGDIPLTESDSAVNGWQKVNGVSLGSSDTESGFHIVDLSQHLVPNGVVGELAVTGVEISRRYPDQTLSEENFVSIQLYGESVRAYLTGDYARVSPTNGELEYIGRIDGEAEARDPRVELNETELSEIEAVLLQHEQISGCAAVLMSVEGKDDLQLVAYITMRDKHEANGTSLEEVALELPEHKLEIQLFNSLRTHLPTYMIPSNVVVACKFPTDANGKTDREALSKLVLEAKIVNRVRERTAPRSATEIALCQYFADVLNMDVGTEDNFFHLGGHSLLAVRLCSRINKELNANVSVRDLFTHPVVSALAEHINSRKSLKYVSIPRAEIQGPVEQSFAQGRLWFLDQLYPESAWYLIPLAIRMKGPLHVDALRLVLAAIEKRHETLRTTFQDVDGISVQIVHPYHQRLPEVINIGSWDDAVQKLQHDHAQPFDLVKTPGWRVEILKLSDSDHILSIVMHHIIGDGWSVNVLEREIAVLYSAAVRGENLQDALSPLPIQYRDFSVWQRQDTQYKQQEEQLKYWKTQLQDNHPAAFLCDKARPKVLSGKAKSTEISITGVLYSKLEQFCKQHQTTAFVVLLAAFRITHFRLTGAIDATVGTPIANRNRQELEDLIGFFVNLQCLRTHIEPGETTFMQMVQQVGDVSSQASANQDVPFERIVAEMLPGHRDLSRNPLAQVAFAVHSHENLGQLPIEGLQTELVNDETTTRFDLELHFFQKTAGLQGLLVHSEELFFQDTINSMLSMFEEILEVGLDHPDASVSTMFLERNLSSLDRFGLADFHRAKYPREESIPTLFRQQTLISGDAIAVTDSSKQLTYNQLNDYSDLLAETLIHRRLSPETLVGTFVPRSCEAVVAFLGILKANLAYLPLDVNAPAARTESILEELPEGSVVLLGAGVNAPRTNKSLEFISIASLYSDTQSLPDTSKWIKPTATGLAYIMYTSGSTGKPKGILAEHRGIVRLVKNTNVASPSQASGTIAHMSNLAFDAATWEIYTALLNGGQVVCIDYMTVLDFPRLSKAFIQHKITVSFITVALLRQILSEFPTILQNLDLVLSGGEKMPVHDAIQAQSLVRGDFYNVYGPTENTSYSTLYQVPASELGVNGVPIGRSISHSGAFVMDTDQQIVPLGVIGELVVVGDGVARGYKDRKLNAGRFFTVNIGGQELRAYRTGDLVRYRTSDGQLEFFGRLDDQVKIRGHRVELAEIEHTLHQHSAVADSVVIVIKEGADMELVSFVTLLLDDKVADDDASGHSGQVENWTSLFDADVYANLQDIDMSDLGRDFHGWKSMYSKELIDKQEMGEWLDDTIATINMGGKPESVLEIGSGTGMILFNLDDGLKSYLGLDLSATAVSFTKQMSERVDSLRGRVDVKVGAADEVTTLFAGSSADVAVINSVAQYFPSSGYLRALTEDLLRFDGMKRIFFGDMRSFALYEEFGVTKALYDFGDKVKKDDIRRELLRLEGSEEELLVDPAFFTGLSDLLPDMVSHVEIVPKVMQATNELSCYRYAAIIHTNLEDRSIHEIAAEAWVNYQDKGLDRASLLSLLEASSSDTVAVAAIPYSKIALERAVLNSLDEETKSVNWLRETRAALNPQASMSPFDIVETANQAGYKVQLSWARQRTQHGAFDVVFHRMKEDNPLFRFPTDHNERSFRSYTTQPLQKRESDRIEQDLRTFVQKSLPDYMVPSRIRVLDKMPLNVNAKADRKKLAEMSLAMTAERGPRDFVEPKNETQRLVCECFSAVLGGILVGITDNFFDIGGHSLLAMRLLASINKTLGWVLNVQDIYRCPTPEMLCSTDFSSGSKKHLEIFSQKPDSKATIVLIHAFMGQGGVYSDLRALLDECLDIIIIHDPYFARLDGPLTVKGVASLYLDGLKQVLSVDKPVFLCGYSYGGLVALDMAAMWEETFQKPLTSLIQLDPGPYEPLTVTDEVMKEEIEYGRHLFGVENERFTMRQLQKLAPLFASLESVPRFDGIGLYVPTLEAKDRGAVQWWNERFPKLETKMVVAPHNTMIEKATVGEVAGIFNEHILRVLGGTGSGGVNGVN